MLKKFNRLLALAAALFAGVGSQAASPAGTEPQKLTMAPAPSGDQNAIIERATRRRALAMAREAAAERARPKREAAKAARAAGQTKQALAAGSPKLALVAGSTQKLGAAAPPGILDPLGTPDYMGGVIPNYANSPALRKFVDTLPGLGPAQANNLGNYIPIAVANTTRFPGSDYYDIGLVDYTQQLHSDLPPTHLRGYKDLNPSADGAAHYLGPVIIAQRDRPVRVTFRNQLPTGDAGNLKIPVDATLMGAGAGPGGTSYTQNRAELHLHGGLNPWISDGTPHQWITPAGDPTPNKKGVAFRNVPDMVGTGKLFPSPTAGDGIGTYFYTNQQSGRFMFYHDHSFGLTRLNVYSGEAAGYLIVDPVETALITSNVLPNNGGGVYNYGIPLVVQDKTFVPGPSDLAAQDPTWDTTNWGGYGDLWYPHVYMPNQNPSDPSGANAMGRWDYGPWFWPPVPVADAPNSIPTANGPVPGANPGDPTYPGTPNPSLTPEAFMDTPVINGTAYPRLTVDPKAYRFRILNAANDRPFGFAFYTADPAAPTEVKMIPASAAEAELAAAAGFVDATGAPSWAADGRAGGVVDWRTAGPNIIQIGNESGFLPTPVVLKSQATTYNYNRRDIVVLDVANHPLFLAPAERADVIVDFSAFAGQTLILYNDMLAPVPAFDVRYDYFTDAPDQTPTGGAPPTPAGYGPNTRTLMQVVVNNTTPAAPFNLAALQSAFTSTSTRKSAFEATQHTPIVPQTYYNSALNKTVATDTFATIQASDLNYNQTENGINVTTPLQPKAIQELFELNYGRMNATLGIELPFTNFNNQTTIPLGYAEPTTEILTDGTTQLWKITHNGVDTHPVHFHLFDVQIVNRVGWDGAVRFPEDNERGWKETVRMKPLEDIIVAFRPISPRLPFTLTNSSRPIDPTKLTTDMITYTDLTNTAVNQGNLGNPITVVNSNKNYGWEYVWHCHILGHEENDFMRPLQLNVATTRPTRPAALTAVKAGPTRVDLAWTDSSTNETGFRVERRPGGGGSYTTVGSTVPNENHFSDMSVVNNTAYQYRIYSYNQAGDSTSSSPTASVTTGTVTPASGVVLDASPATSATVGTDVLFTATASGATGYQYQFLVNGAMVQDYSVSNTFDMLGANSPVGSYTVQVNVRTSTASAIVSASVPYTITAAGATGVQLLPNLPSPQNSNKIIVFTATGIGSTGYYYQFSVDGTVLQAYSTTAKFTLPASIMGSTGLHAVKVDVVTALPPKVTPDASTVVSYTINALVPLAPIAITPNGNPSSSTPIYTFNAVLGATGYMFTNFNSSTGAYYSRWYTAVECGIPTGTGVGSILQPNALADGVYSWGIYAHNSAGISAISNELNFTIGILPSAPTPYGPSGSGITTTPTYTFSAVPGATGYRFTNFSSSTGAYYSRWYTAAECGVPSGTGVGRIVQPTPLPDGVYSWGVYAENVVGVSPLSTELIFTVGAVPIAPTPIGPTGAGISNTPTFTFNAVQGATGYMFTTFSSLTGAYYSRWYTAAECGVPSGTGVGSIVQPAPLPPGTYSWAINARNLNGMSPLSQYLYFIIP